MKGPSIAVMLGGGKPKGDDYEEDGDLSLSETKARAEDAATAFAASLEGGDAKAIVKAFCTLSTLCHHLEDLEESGETDDEEEAEAEDEPEESAEE